MSSLDLDSIHLGYPRILVIGDAMLDRYVWGTAERVSPEAPVLVLNVEQREVRLGGAASTTMLLRGLEAEVVLASVVGDDHDGRTLERLLDEIHADRSLLLIDKDRPTTTKERYLGRCEQRQPHQMLRVDTEQRSPLRPELEQTLLQGISSQLHSFDAVLISDYAKGVCKATLLRSVIQECRNENIPVLIDPGRGADFANYRGATLLKPNRTEAETAIGRPLRTPADACTAAVQLRNTYDLEAVVITLDKDGLVTSSSPRPSGERPAEGSSASIENDYLSIDENSEHLPIDPHEVCDITGAGDTVLATLGLALASNLSLPLAAELANAAAALQVAQPGVVPVSREQLWQSIESSKRPPSSEHKSQVEAHVHGSRQILAKVTELAEAAKLAEEYRRQQKTVVFTNGCFDLLHCGHVTSLEQAASLGDVLIVGLNDDDSVRALKGPQRPVIPAPDRARMLASLACVDHVVIFGNPTPHTLLQKIRPDVLVKGGSSIEIVGREIVEAYGGRVVQTAMIPDLSTSQLVSRIRYANDNAFISE